MEDFFAEGEDIRGTALRQLMSKILGVVGGHPGGGTSPLTCQIQAVLTRKTPKTNRFRCFMEAGLLRGFHAVAQFSPDGVEPGGAALANEKNQAAINREGF
ncbi:MAG: hypothetical protein M0Q93_09185 [Terrimicrobiaceae bacterium]|nr:hypothetical protein [Terrimicrobiaceae bacterium]